MTKIQKLRTIFLLSIFYFLISILPAQAAKLYFEPQEQVIGTEKEFSIAVDIDAEKSINAIQAALSIPKEFTLIDIAEGNSIINFWVEKPNFDETSRLLIFSGIIPGGFQGEKALLLIVKFKTARQEGRAYLSFNKEKTRVYLHTPEGIEDSLGLESLTLPIAKGKENIGVEIIDRELPEDFKPEIARDPNIFEGKWFLVFATQDKGSGIYHYEAQETKDKRLETRKWIEVESPYLLKDQKLRSFIYVKAVDKAGNERVAIVEPRYPMKWYENWLIWIIMAIIGAIAYLIWKKFKNK